MFNNIKQNWTGYLVAFVLGLALGMFIQGFETAAFVAEKKKDISVKETTRDYSEKLIKGKSDTTRIYTLIEASRVKGTLYKKAADNNDKALPSDIRNDLSAVLKPVDHAKSLKDFYALTEDLIASWDTTDRIKGFKASVSYNITRNLWNATFYLPGLSVSRVDTMKKSFTQSEKSFRSSEALQVVQSLPKLALKAGTELSLINNHSLIKYLDLSYNHKISFFYISCEAGLYNDLKESLSQRLNGRIKAGLTVIL